MGRAGAGALAALEATTAALTAAGVPTTANVADVAVPGAWCKPISLDRTTLGGNGTLRCELWVLAPAHGAENARTSVLGQLDQVLDVVDDLVDESDPFPLNVELILPDGGSYPATRLTLDLPF